MEKVIAACAQPRMTIPESSDQFEAEARRFLRQSQAKAAQLVIFPEFTGVMLAAPLISQLKLGFIKRADQGKHPRAGILGRGMGLVSGATAGALGGGLPGSLKRLLGKKSDDLRDLYFETFGKLAREFGAVIVGGSLYLYDAESDTIRNRAYVFDTDGEVLGYQDKLNLAFDEKDLAAPGSDLSVIETRLGRLGLLIGRDTLYPELARLLAILGADLLVGLVASPGAAQAAVVRSAMAVRTDENQVFAAVSFLLGPNFLDRTNPEDYFGRSALLAPISLTEKGDGILIEAGTNRTETLIAAELNMDALYTLRETGRFQPRQEINLGNLGPVLAEMYQEGLTIEQAQEKRLAGKVPPAPESMELEPSLPAEPISAEVPEEAPEPAAEPAYESVPEAMSLTRSSEAENE